MELQIAARPYDDPDVARMIADVQAIYVQMYGSPDEAVVAADEFASPNGVLLVGVLDGEAVAMGGWRRLTGSPEIELADAAAVATAEIKRMYVAPTVQRRGIGRAMLGAVEASAAEAGVERLLLNTGPHQLAAIALYEAEGYVPDEPFGHYAGHGEALFMSKPLPPASSGRDEARLA